MKRAVDNPVFLTTREAATTLRLSSRTLEGLRRNGNGPIFTRLGTDQNSRVVYRRADIDFWLMDKSHRQVVRRREPRRQRLGVIWRVLLNLGRSIMERNGAGSMLGWNGRNFRREAVGPSGSIWPNQLTKRNDLH